MNDMDRIVRWPGRNDFKKEIKKKDEYEYEAGKMKMSNIWEEENVH